MKTLPDNFYQAPGHAFTSMSIKDLRELLLSTDGWVMACGHIYDIKSKPLGAGVFKVTLQQQRVEEDKDDQAQTIAGLLEQLVDCPACGGSGFHEDDKICLCCVEYSQGYTPGKLPFERATKYIRDKAKSIAGLEAQLGEVTGRRVYYESRIIGLQEEVEDIDCECKPQTSVDNDPYMCLKCAINEIKVTLADAGREGDGS